ncbi:hypothetical protein M422DRAFT_273804 [Sphaerobolus stellatus SS14]|uniref:Uncharacterized protein n=1 Tax=Sphaerobolus stellatus (strain SS14) TaxID=990650 RepID=A0A0C9UIP2_SPHS4|nr:hypothetical protein M422DRAFT_273804 [Sphaerobolus stellatus SS14]
MSNTFIRRLLHVDTRALHRDGVMVTTLSCAHPPTSCYSLFCNLALQEWMTMHAAGTPSRLRDLILALHLLPVPVSLSPAALDMSHVEGVRKALQASMSRSLTDATTKSDKLLLLQDRRERNKDVKDHAQTFSTLCSAGSLDLRAAATLALSPSHSPSSESLFNRINARKPKLNILGPLLNGKQCFMNILSIFQASTELEEISIEYDTHGQSTPTSSSHRISLQSLKNMILVGTDAAQSMDYIEAPSLEQLSVYFSYTLGSIVIRHLILWINFPSIKALIVREKSSWDVDGIHMDDRFSSWSQRISKNGWQYTISESNPRSEYEDAKSDCRFYFATSRMISIGIMESSYFSKMPKFTGN